MTRLDAPVAYLAATSAKWGALETTGFAGSIRFTAAPGEDRLRELESHGLRFAMQGSRTVRPAWIPLAALPHLAERADVMRVECAWRPPSVPPLARMIPQVEADRAWTVPSPLGGTVTGRGVIVCDMDTGVNVLHASLFRLSGESFTWLDVDGSGTLTDGDAVDLDRDGVAGPCERLRHREATGTSRFGNYTGLYDADLDYLFNDVDVDWNLDQGPPAYDDTDPCLGERLFLCDDRDGDGSLDVGEPLLALGPSCIRAIRDRAGVVYRRGVDLLACEGDLWNHGTPVSGILAGGSAGRHRMTGAAPGVELLHVILDYPDEPQPTTSTEAGLAWAVAEGARVVLIENGEWVWRSLDGSSNLETMMDEFAADAGVVFVVPVGNLGSSTMHARFGSEDDQALDVDGAATTVWISFHWTDEVGRGLRVEPPGEAAVALPLDGSTVATAGYRLWSCLTVSPRGTRRLDLRLTATDEEASAGGRWRFDFAGRAGEIHGYFFDDASGWVSPSSWMTGTEVAATATWPATADCAIGVAAYDDFDDSIAFFSGRGPRLDGAAVVDIAAPGFVVTAPDADNPNGFAAFHGTSAAAPFVAGAVALLLELRPDLDAAACLRYLQAGAAPAGGGTDVDAAGAGLLRIHAAMRHLLDDLSRTPPPAAPTVSAVPNPFYDQVAIRYEAEGGEPVQVRIFDAAGREVWSTAAPPPGAGSGETIWNGRTAGGATAPSGVYLVHVRQGDRAGACKVVIVR
ncbi:MAG: S8 family serine peptidase [Candidatus Krumholzibacteriia bacterium]